MKHRLQIGVFGHHFTDLDPEIIKATESIGKKVAEMGHILITGASTGVSYFAAKGAKKAGGLTVGIIPGTFQNINHSFQESINTDYIDIIIATGFGFKGRNVLSLRSCNAAIFINGATGTLNEFLIAVDEMEGRCFILNNSGGILNIAPNLIDHLDDIKKRKISLCNLELLIKELGLLK